MLLHWRLELEILSCAISCICSNYSFILLNATVHGSLQCWMLLQHVQMLVYGRQAAFDATVQTLEAHYARTVMLQISKLSC